MGGPPTAPLVCLLLAAALWGLLLEDRATCAAMDTARKSSGELALVREPNLFQKLPGVLPGTGSQEEFLKSNQLPAKPVRLLEGYALAVFLLSAAVAGLTCRGSTAAYFQYWTARAPGRDASGGYSGLVQALVPPLPPPAGPGRGPCMGWTGACRLAGKLVVPVSDRDLFPGDNVKMNGVKYFGGHTPDQVLPMALRSFPLREAALPKSLKNNWKFAARAGIPCPSCAVTKWAAWALRLAPTLCWWVPCGSCNPWGWKCPRAPGSVRRCMWPSTAA